MPTNSVRPPPRKASNLSFTVWLRHAGLIAAQLRSDAFPVAFRRVLYPVADAEPFYHYAVCYRFDDLVAHYREIPSFQPYFNLMAAIPIDGAGCPALFVPSALVRVSLHSVTAPSARSRYGFAFVVLIHRWMAHLAGFLNRLQGADTAFVMGLDTQSLGLTEAVEHRLTSIANIYIAEPQVKICRSCASLAYRPWIAVQAAFRLGLECDWFSLQSAVDALV
jgi:hypothetical protein